LSRGAEKRVAGEILNALTAVKKLLFIQLILYVAFEYWDQLDRLPNGFVLSILAETVDMDAFFGRIRWKILIIWFCVSF